MSFQKYSNKNVTDEITAKGLSSPSIDVLSPVFFGQCAEDYIVLSMLRALAASESIDLREHRYLEVGANHPVATSATYLLHMGLGMQGVLIDANPSLIPELKKTRPHDRVIHAAVTDDPQVSEVKFYISSHSELSSLNSSFIESFPHVSAKVVEEVSVPATTLSDILKNEFSNSPPLFLSIDVEGMDERIIKSLNLSDCRPYIIQIESNKEWDENGFLRIANFLASHGYKIAAQTDVNAIYFDTHRVIPHAPRLDQRSEHHFRSVGISEASLRDYLQRFDVLSLDVFDTILFRRCLKPTDVFGYIEVAFGPADYKAWRIAAEARARNSTRPDVGSEVSIDEIYHSDSDAPDKLAKSTELRAEMKFLRPQTEILRVIDIAKSIGLKVIAVSDIYYTSETISNLLSRAGIVVDRVFTSCDYRNQDAGKYNGRLYGRVSEEIGTPLNKILHMGDNIHADVFNARAAGVQALHLKTVAQVFEQEHLFGRVLADAHNNSGRIVAGQIAANFFAAPRKTDFYNIGHAIGGPLVLGFSQFIIEKAKTESIKSLKLLARDGAIIAKALDILCPHDLSWELVPSSRRLTCFPLYASRGWDAISPMFDESVITQDSFLERLSLQRKSNTVKIDGALRPESMAQAMHNFLLDEAKQEANSIRSFFQSSVSNHRSGEKLAWVDVGWALSSINALNTTLDIDGGAFFIGSHERAHKGKSFHGYLFQDGHPFKNTEVIMRAVEFIELIFSDDSASAASISKASEGSFAVNYTDRDGCDIIRGRYINEIQSGIIDFLVSIKDIADGLDSEELRKHNLDVLLKICRAGPDACGSLLASVPHDRGAGRGRWRTVGDYWKIQPDSHFAARSSLKLKSSIYNKVAFHVLTALSKLSFISTRKREKFKRSAAKRAD